MKRSFLFAYGVWLFVIAAYFLPGATWNPVSRFALTRAIVEHQTLSIDPYEPSTGDRAMRDGHFYTDKAPIPSLLAVPAYAVYRAIGREPQFEPVTGGRIRVNRAFGVGLWVCSLTTSAVAAAILGVLLFETARRRTTSFGALVASSSIVLATPLLPYATSFYGHELAALFLFLAVVIAGKDDPSRRDLRVAGACMALAAGCEYLTVIPSIVIALFIVVRRPRHAIDVAVGGALPLILIAGYHTVCFGAPWRTGYSFLMDPQFVVGHAGGAMGLHPPKLVALGGLLFGPRRGLFLIAPIAAAATVGLALSARSGDRTSRVALATAVAMLLAASGYYMWWGGAAAGPRHLVPILPPLAYGLATLWRFPRARIVVCLLAIVSFGFVLAITTVGLEAPERGNILFYAWSNLRRGAVAQIPGASNLGLLVGLRGIASIVPLLVWTVAGFGWLVRRTRAA